MANWTVSGDKKNDFLRGLETLRAVAKTDWNTEIVKIEKEAAELKAQNLGKRGDRMIEQLRRDWKAAQGNISFINNHPAKKYLDNAG